LMGMTLKDFASEFVGRRCVRGIAWRLGVIAEVIPRRTTLSIGTRKTVSCQIHMIT